MSNIINTRSPYYARFPRENALSVKLNITIYTGVQGDAPVNANYTLTKNTDEPTGAASEQAVFEISELIRDFIYTEYYEEAVDVVWVKLEHIFYDGLNATGNVLSGGGINYYLAVDGFGYFEEGINPRKTIDPTAVSFTPMLLQDNTTIYFIKGQPIRIPIWAETEPLIGLPGTWGEGVQWQDANYFWEEYVATWNSSLDDVQIDDNGNTNQKIQYVIIFPTDDIETGDTATITSTIGTAQSITVTFKELCELKYTPVRVIFYNKYGALQDIWASKKSIKNLNQTADTYKSNIIDLGTLSYSTYKHVQKRFDVQGQETISVSTAYLDESVNEPVKQLLMSEQVWIEIGAETYPVVLKTSSIQEKTSVNDKLVAYTFEFEYASGKIQNVR
jgi:hypothetical protein